MDMNVKGEASILSFNRGPHLILSRIGSLHLVALILRSLDSAHALLLCCLRPNLPNHRPQHKSGML